VELIENLVFSKDIEIKYHYIIDMVHKGAMNLLYVATNEHIEYVLTKPLSRVKFEYFRYKLEVIQNDFPR
jgi:hypothetical protein